MTRLFAFLSAVLLAALPASAQNFPDYTELYVNDFANLLSSSEADAIRTDLQELREKRDIEFTVVTIDQMSAYGHHGAIEPFATGLFNYWGVGNASRNDGIMMLIAQYDREMRIEVGSGYGSSLDKPMKRIIDNTITPQFKTGDFAGGIADGVDEVIYQLTGTYPGAIDGTILQKTQSMARRVVDTLKWFLLPIGGVLSGFGWWMYRRWARYRKRRCPVDGTKMQLLAEHWDDKHLNEGERTEEELKSVDYDVWLCPDCEHLTIEAYKSWFSRFSACRACNYKTLEGTTTILSHATTSSTGSKRIDYECHHCNEHYSVRKVIPKVSKSSSSSSGGSSSFGGGSSSGGGASGSW